MSKKLVWNTGGIMLTGKTKSILGKPVLMPLCPPKIPHELTWD